MTLRPLRGPAVQLRRPGPLAGRSPGAVPPGRAPARRLVLATALIYFGAGCSSGGPAAPPKWKPELRSVFNNASLRPSEPPMQLWTAEDEDLLLRRVGFADVAAVGVLRLMRTVSHFGGAQRIYLTFRSKEVLHGKLDGHLDSDGEIVLELDRSEEEFLLALRLEERLPGSRYLIFLKNAAADPKGSPAFRWALYRPDARLIAAVRAMYSWLGPKDKGPPSEESGPGIGVGGGGDGKSKGTGKSQSESESRTSDPVAGGGGGSSAKGPAD